MSDVQGNQEQRTFREEASSLWLIVLAPVLWAVHFVAVYGLTAMTCAKFGTPEAVTLLRIAIAVLTFVALGGIGMVGIKSWRQWDYLADHDYSHHLPTGEHRHEFLGHAAFLLSVMSAIAVVYTALPAVFIGTCA